MIKRHYGYVHSEGNCVAVYTGDNPKELAEALGRDRGLDGRHGDIVLVNLEVLTEPDEKEHCPYYWGDHTKQCLLPIGYDGICTYPLTEKDVQKGDRCFTDGDTSKISQLRDENERLQKGYEEQHRLRLVERDERDSLNAELATLREENDQLRCDLITGTAPIVPLRSEVERLKSELGEIKAVSADTSESEDVEMVRSYVPVTEWSDVWALQIVSRFRAREAALRTEVATLREESERLHCQLAGCGGAALGATREPLTAHRGGWGWSPSYYDVLDLRRRFDDTNAELATLRAKLTDVLKILLQEVPDCEHSSVLELAQWSVKMIRGLREKLAETEKTRDKWKDMCHEKNVDQCETENILREQKSEIGRLTNELDEARKTPTFAEMADRFGDPETGALASGEPPPPSGMRRHEGRGQAVGLDDYDRAGIVDFLRRLRTAAGIIWDVHVVQRVRQETQRRKLAKASSVRGC